MSPQQHDGPYLPPDTEIRQRTPAYLSASGNAFLWLFRTEVCSSNSNNLKQDHKNNQGSARRWKTVCIHRMHQMLEIFSLWSLTCRDLTLCKNCKDYMGEVYISTMFSNCANVKMQLTNWPLPLTTWLYIILSFISNICSILSFIVHVCLWRYFPNSLCTVLHVLQENALLWANISVCVQAHDREWRWHFSKPLQSLKTLNGAGFYFLCVIRP